MGATYAGQHKQRKERDVQGEGAPKKLATATQPQLPRNVTDFKQATDFQISRLTLSNLIFN
jgi:hypothetical protein